MESVGATGQDFPKSLPLTPRTAHSGEAGGWGRGEWRRRRAGRWRRRRRHSIHLRCSLCCPLAPGGAPSAAVRCPAPVSFENGLYTPRLGSHPVGGNLSFECEDGFVLRGSPVRWCRPNGAWDGETAVCDDGGECTPGASGLHTAAPGPPSRRPPGAGPQPREALPSPTPPGPRPPLCQARPARGLSAREPSWASAAVPLSVTSGRRAGLPASAIAVRGTGNPHRLGAGPVRQRGREPRPRGSVHTLGGRGRSSGQRAGGRAAGRPRGSLLTASSAPRSRPLPQPRRTRGLGADGVPVWPWGQGPVPLLLLEPGADGVGGARVPGQRGLERHRAHLPP